LKKKRRVEVGNRVSLVFENRDTVLFQIQEMMRAERMVDDNEIKFEVDTYNELIPERNELSATLFIEVDDPQLLRPVLDSFIGYSPGCSFNLVSSRNSFKVATALPPSVRILSATSSTYSFSSSYND